jgi:type I restriction-modification system DNA methylase subunit
MIDQLTAKKRISNLVTRFDEQFNSYKNPDYNETKTRRDFIDPFFKALGWDIDNEEGYAEAYREVIQEDKVKIGKATKAPDYSFRLVGGKRLFFVEAKKPCISVKDDIHSAYQVRRYGWSAKLPISIITDFEEFAIYDCTNKPDLYDKTSVARLKYFTFRDYIKEFDFIWETFSKEQVLKGSFDKFVLSDTHKKGTTSVDKDFLDSLDKWRTYLAVNISWNNKNLDEDEINFAVQQTIDRIIFLRIAEDRSIEPYGNLKHVIKQGNLYSNLFEHFRKADEKYNSGLFDLKKDRISTTLKIENKIIKTIINELYYPECPYEFSVLPVEILGSAYEQFLGKVIRITPAHHAKIEEKPEVRKAGGVYYTPQYIVEYIVKNTIGILINGKTPKEISKIKIVDPACGSGSFLIGAYQYLLDWHKNYYSNYGKISKGNKENPLTPDGHLTTSEKKRILINNIYGVDIDVNATEVTKLSLLLKCLEGETEASIASQLRLFNERVLPTLDNNIKDGNSLVDTDFYDSQLDFGDEKKIKPFHWQNGFIDVFNHGGFDVVIGNPPYVFGRDWKSLGISDDMKSYLGSHYKSSPYQLDFFSIFMEKGIRLVNDKGYVSFIVPNVWLTNIYSSSTRKFLLMNAAELKIAVPEIKVFEGLTVDTVIFILRKGKRNISFYTISKLDHSKETLISELEFSEY